MRPSSHIALALGLGLALSALAPRARASATFPEALRSKLGLAQIAGSGLGCQLCHQDDKGGLKTATKPFGRSVLRAGAMGASVPSLLAALDTLKSQASDSDSDGIPDIDELKAGTDPNVGSDGIGPPQDDIPLPQTGCSLAPRSTPLAAWLAFAAALAFALRRRRV